MDKSYLCNIKIKLRPCHALHNLEAFKIVKANASKISYGGILKQNDDDKERLEKFTSRIWNKA